MTRALYLLLAWAIPALAAHPWGGEISDSLPAGLRKAVMKEFKTDTRLLTLLHVRPWKSFPNRYVAFGCFAKDSAIYFHYNNSYRIQGQFDLEANCKADMVYNRNGVQNQWIPKQMELMIFEWDSGGSVHPILDVQNPLEPWTMGMEEERVIAKSEDEEGALPRTPHILWSENPSEEEYSGVPLGFESLDLAPYALSDSSRALGLRMGGTDYYAGGGYLYSQFLVLFELRTDTLLPVFSHLMKYEGEYAGEWNADGTRGRNGNSAEYLLKISSPKSQTKARLEIWQRCGEFWSQGRVRYGKSRHVTTFAWDSTQGYYLPVQMHKRKGRR